METNHVPTKFVVPLNSHLICWKCKQLFSNPVINVQCGHTFCRECALVLATNDTIKGEKSLKCPIDGSSCTESSLVVNRALLNQIQDLKIFCQHGLTWRNDEYMRAEDGCPQQIALGQRNLHEDYCEYAFVTCSYGNEHCGFIRKKHIADHEANCTKRNCPFSQKGCSFIGSEESINRHRGTCEFKSFEIIASNNNLIRILQQKNEILQETVEKLTTRVSSLENENTKYESKLEQCLRSVSELDTKYSTMFQDLLVNCKVKNRSTSLGAVSENSPGNSLIRKSSRTSLNMSTSKCESWMMPFQFKCIGTLRGHSAVIWSLLIHNNLLYSCGDDKCIKLWDLEALEKGCKQTIQAHSDKVHALTVSSEYIFSGGGDGCLQVWNIHDRSHHQTIQNAHDEIVAAMVCTEEYLFTSSHTVIKVWKISQLQCVHIIEGLHHWVRSLALNKTKEILYSGSHNTIDVWETSGEFKLKGKISHSYGSVHSLAITDSYIIAGTYNKNIQIFKVNNHVHLQTLSGHIGIITSIVASKSGRFLFTASSDSVVNLWNLQNMLPIHSLNRHEGSVNAVVLHNDLLLSGAEDHEIKVFKYSKMQPGFIPA